MTRTDLKKLRGARKSKLPTFIPPQLATCDLNQLPAAIGSNYLPQVHNNRAISDFKFPLVFEFWNPPIAESANWNLSLAESSKLIRIVLQFPIYCTTLRRIEYF
jgi:hypothetical protein